MKKELYNSLKQQHHPLEILYLTHENHGLSQQGVCDSVCVTAKNRMCHKFQPAVTHGMILNLSFFFHGSIFFLQTTLNEVLQRDFQSRKVSYKQGQATFRETGKEKSHLFISGEAHQSVLDKRELCLTLFPLRLDPFLFIPSTSGILSDQVLGRKKKLKIIILYRFMIGFRLLLIVA